MKHYARWLALGLLILAPVYAMPLSAQTSTQQIVTVDLSHPLTTSTFTTGFSQIDNSLRYPYDTNDQAAVQNAKTLIHDGLAFVNQHLMAWGSNDPWPDPAQPEPTNWGSLDAHMNII